MKVLSIPQQIFVEKYEASDGKVFDDKESCVLHENKIFFDSFVLDESKLKGKLSEDNWRHYVYAFIKKFMVPIETSVTRVNPDIHKMLQESNYISHFKPQFDVKNVIEAIFRPAFFEIPYYDERHRDGQSKYLTRQRVSERLYRKGIQLKDWYSFIYETGLLDIKDVAIFYKVASEDEEYEDIVSKWNSNLESKQNREYDIFFTCLDYNCTESYEIASKHLNLNIMSLYDYRSGGWSSDGMKMDIISEFAFGCSDKFTERFIKGIDDDKRVKWLEYLINKDYPIKLYRYVDNMHEDNYIREVDEKNKKYINYSIEDLINYVQDQKEDCDTYIFRGTADKICDILRNSGANFKEVNANNKKPKYYELVEYLNRNIIKIISKYPEIKIVKGRHTHSDIYRIVSKQWEKDKYSRKVEVSYFIDDINRTYNSKRNVCLVEFIKMDDYRVVSKDIIGVYDLSKYINKKDELVKELIFQMNLKTPLVNLDGDIKEIEKEINSIKRQKEELERMEKQLTDRKNKKLREVD